MAETDDNSLIVEGVPERRPTVIDPGVVAHLVQRAQASVLLVPARD